MIRDLSKDADKEAATAIVGEIINLKELTQKEEFLDSLEKNCPEIYKKVAAIILVSSSQ